MALPLATAPIALADPPVDDAGPPPDNGVVASAEPGIVTTPGNGFGEAGEGFVRFALTVDKTRLAEAVERMKKLGL